MSFFKFLRSKERFLKTPFSWWLVWKVGLTVDIKRRFVIFPVLCGGCLSHWVFFACSPTSFPGSLVLPPPGASGKMRDPGNEVACSLELLIKSLSYSLVHELWLGLFNRNRNTHLSGRKWRSGRLIGRQWHFVLSIVEETRNLDGWKYIHNMYVCTSYLFELHRSKLVYNYNLYNCFPIWWDGGYVLCIVLTRNHVLNLDF